MAVELVGPGNSGVAKDTTVGGVVSEAHSKGQREIAHNRWKRRRKWQVPTDNACDAIGLKVRVAGQIRGSACPDSNTEFAISVGKEREIVGVSGGVSIERGNGCARPDGEFNGGLAHADNCFGDGKLSEHGYGPCWARKAGNDKDDGWERVI